MKITEKNFIKHFKKGREAALEYVIREYIGIVKAITYNALRSYQDPHLVEECMSDTFLGAFDNASQFSGDAEDFRKWLSTIAKFKAVDAQRKRGRIPVPAELKEYQIETRSAEEEYMILSSTEELLRMMDQFQEIDRDIFTMKYFLNMGNEEIAGQLGMTVPAVTNRLYRGRKRLQNLRLKGGFLTL